MKTLLEIVQDACRRVGQPRPSVVASATSDTPLRMMTLLNEAGKALLKDHEWNALTDVESFTAVATQAQDHPHPPVDFDRFHSQSQLWDVGNKRPVVGPLSMSKWLQLTVNDIGTTTKNWALIAGQINIFPVPTTSDTFRYVYQSKYWVLNAASAPKAEFTADDDTPRIDDELLILDLVWRWKQAIGIDYAEDMSTYARYKETAIAADRGPRILNLSTTFDRMPDGFLDQEITG